MRTSPEYEQGYRDAERASTGMNRTGIERLWKTAFSNPENRRRFPQWTAKQHHAYDRGQAAALRDAYKASPPPVHGAA